MKMKTNINYGFVIRGEIRDISNLLDFIEENDLKIVYKEVSPNRLYITSTPPKYLGEEDEE